MEDKMKKRISLLDVGVKICIAALVGVIILGIWGLITGIDVEAQPIGVSTDQVAISYAYDGSNRLQYIGECLPQYQRRGNSTVWRIKKYTYDGVSTRILTIHWASRDAGYIHAWNLRTTYTY